MLALNLNDLPLRTTWTRDVPRQRANSTFPFLGQQANENTSVVYVELEPGKELGSHTDSAEEVLFIFEGTVEVIVGDESAIVQAPSLALVPTLAPHNLRNVGAGPVKFVGFFPAHDIVATFENAWLPDNANVVDTAAIALAFHS